MKNRWLLMGEPMGEYEEPWLSLVGPMRNRWLLMGEREEPWLSLVGPESGLQPDTKRLTKSWRL